jgi:hypothetical protein
MWAEMWAEGRKGEPRPAGQAARRDGALCGQWS